MDSLTQIVLGAAVGEAVLGKKIGNKAMLYGAIAGTIPDLDTFASHFTDTVTALQIHRGFTHSIIFSLLFAPVFGKIVSLYDKSVSWKSWSWLFFFGLITHPMLDAFTTWGTQFFWPSANRLAFKTIFVIDPLYTIPFIVCLILAMRLPKTNRKRSFYNKLGISISSAYLLLSVILKFITYQKFTEALQTQNIAYTNIITKPTAFNTILWTANVDTPTAYLIGHYSFFDTQPIHFASYPKNHELLTPIKEDKSIQKLIKISEGWYSITKKENQLYFNDLRFGLLSLSPKATNFAFSYRISQANKEIQVTEVKKDRENAKNLLSSLLKRIRGN